jgi:hypothetical protein
MEDAQGVRTAEAPHLTAVSPEATQLHPRDAAQLQARRAFRAKPPTYLIAHWYQLLDGLGASPLEFYAAVESALERRSIPDRTLRRVNWREGGVFSARREYLRVKRSELLFDICGAPFGRGFFISWWLGERGFWKMLAELPWIGGFVRIVVRQDTYYKIDTALMFQEAVHGAVLEVLDDMTDAKGLRRLSDLERKPILRDFYRH